MTALLPRLPAPGRGEYPSAPTHGGEERRAGSGAVGYQPRPLRLEAWPDPVVEAIGFGVRSPYVEFCYAGVLGPTPLLILRAAAVLVAAGPVTVELGEFARGLGVGAGSGRNSAISRSLARLESFGCVISLPGGYALRQALRPLSHRQLVRATAPVRDLHHRLLYERQRLQPRAG